MSTWETDPLERKRSERRGCLVIGGVFGGWVVFLFWCAAKSPFHQGAPHEDVTRADLDKLFAYDHAAPPAAVMGAPGGAATADADAGDSLEAVRARRAELAKLPLAERVKRAKAACAADCPTDETDDLLAASATDAERAAIEAAIAPLVARAKAKAKKADEAQHAKEREWVAEAWDQQLLIKHMNPQGVHAYGKTLHFDGWFCSRQFLYDFMHGGGLQEATGAGFTRVECSNSLETWSQEL